MTQQNNNSPIYHYTSVAGLFGMLNSISSENTITKRATHSLYMNDPMEFSYGAKLLDSVIKVIEEELMIDEKERIAGALSMPKILQAQSEIEGHIGVPYISSFSYIGDNLPMWRMYADNGKGVIIEFDKSKLLECSNDNRKLIDCRYYDSEKDIEKDKEYYQSEYERLKNLYRRRETPKNKHENILIFAFHISALLSPMIKHTAYEYEQEFRIVSYKEGNTQYRESNGMIIPYVDIDIPIDAIRKIHIGPNADYGLLRNSLRMFQYSKGINIDIDKSKIHYRG